MGRRRFIESEQDKLDRIQRLTSAIAEIESYLQFFDDKGEQADVGCWGVRYQVRQRLIWNGCHRSQPTLLHLR